MHAHQTAVICLTQVGELLEEEAGWFGCWVWGWGFGVWGLGVWGGGLGFGGGDLGVGVWNGEFEDGGFVKMDVWGKG